MNTYLVRYVIKDGGYSSGDDVSSGGYHDTHHHIIITTHSSKVAQRIVEDMLKLTQSNKRCVVKRPVKLA